MRPVQTPKGAPRHVCDEARTELREFLKTIWPSQGYYCVVQPQSKDGRSWWHHASYPTQEEAVEKLLALGQFTDTYFAVLSLREPFIRDPAKLEKAKAAGRTINDFTDRSYRVNSNMAWARSFFVDLDVGKEDGYATQAVAFEALKTFCKDVGLPKPFVVCSGVGLHVYWTFAEDVPASDWRIVATKLKELARPRGFKVGAERTADVASVLRVPGSYHFKDPANPKRGWI